MLIQSHLLFLTTSGELCLLDNRIDLLTGSACGAGKCTLGISRTAGNLSTLTDECACEMIDPAEERRARRSKSPVVRRLCRRVKVWSLPLSGLYGLDSLP